RSFLLKPTLLNCTTATPGRGGSNGLSLLQPYDFLYYTGVRSYFGEEWVKAAELLEKAIITKQSLLRVRRRCHDECVAAGRDAFKELDSEGGSLWDLWTLDWVQQKAECLRFCIGRSVTPAGQLPVSTDIEYEFSSRNPYNFLQVTYYKLDKLQKAASAAHTYFVANPSHLEMRNNIEKYRRMDGVTEEAFQDRELENEKHWVRFEGPCLRKGEGHGEAAGIRLTLPRNHATDECRVQCEVASQRLPEDRGVDSHDGVFEKAAALSLSLLSCRQSCVTQVATRPGRISSQEDFLTTQLEHLHIAQFKGQGLEVKLKITQNVTTFLSHPFSFVLAPGGPVLQVGVTITMDDQVMNGTNRVVLDGVMTEKECDRILHLATAAASAGDGYRGRRSPHTPHETFEGLTVLRAVKLAQDGMVNQSDARLLHELGERVRVLLHSYFRSPSGLFTSFTHLVCRSAVAGDQKGRLDLSHPIHVDNCLLEPETNQCWREPPAFIHRDLSAVLYLNDNFNGGELFFTNRNAKTITARVKPSCGRLVGFSSGPVNPHGVTAVTSGRRCALALWFTKEKIYRDMVSKMTAHGSDLLLGSDLSPAVTSRGREPERI
uniref:procollagen-proline 3-dioxygenase n=1 Tax=Cyclopterus lumpus TaxID=8103 RepID=A0A8C2X427_CYCLU